jgi:flagellar biosynthesis protein FlhB
MSGEDDASREHEPTQKKLDDARARGDVARSADLTYAGGMAGFLALSAFAGAKLLIAFGDRAQAYLGGFALTGAAAGAPSGALVAGRAVAMVLPILPFLLLPGLVSFLALVAQRGLVFAGEKLAPKLSRIDPLQNAKQKFGRTGLFEFAKSAVKLLVTGCLLGWFLARNMSEIMMTAGLPAGAVSGVMTGLLLRFLMLVAAIALVIGLADFGWQRLEHLRRNKMSRQELMEEFKQSEGDPHMKGHRRRRAEEIAMNRMLADVPKADVVVVNPTHFAVALKWNRASGRAPVCVAKGVDEVAARIREAAATAGVPIHSDPPTARAIHATVEIGREIRPDHYAPVAAAIRFAERMRRRAREQGTSGGWARR